MISWPNFVSQLFNGLALGALLALISSGLTIIYGTLGVLNLAHGAMFMLGGYAGYVAYTYTGSFVVAVIAGSLFVMVVGVRDGARHHPPLLSAGRMRTSCWSPSASASVFVEIVRLIFASQSQIGAAAAAVPGHHLARLHVLSDLSPRGGRHRRGRAAARCSSSSTARGSA